MGSDNRPSKDFAVFNNMTREEALAFVDEQDWRRPTKKEVNQYYDSIFAATKPPTLDGPA